MKLGKSLRYLYIQKESQNSSSTLIIIEKLYILKFYNCSVANKEKKKKRLIVLIWFRKSKAAEKL